MSHELKILIFRIAEQKLKRELNDLEKQRIESIYNASDIIDITEKSIVALQKALDPSFAELLIEKRNVNFSLDAIQMLMLQLRKEAAKQNSKRK